MLPTVQPSGTFRLNVIQCAVDTPADCFPVDAHVLRHSTSGEISRKPADREIKVFCKAAARICPWNISDKDAMDRALDTVCMTLHLNKRPSPVKSSPYTGSTALGIITRTGLMTEWTVIFVPLIGTGLNPDVVHSIFIGIKITASYNCGLDIE